MDVETHHQWVLAMKDARRRLSRLKAGVAVGGTVVLGVVAALAAAASTAPSASSAAPAAPSNIDVFGQGTQGGRDEQPPAVNPANPIPADNQVQGAPSIVTAPS